MLEALSLEQIVEASTPGKVARLVHKEPCQNFLLFLCLGHGSDNPSIQELPFRFAARIQHIEACLAQISCRTLAA